ncbi:ABZJ_00895 family protein [Epibacterium ulvae]|uniref:ABZJ_00895 family protein n=1 Tax=Epibacterium ulvae TaxID=1156985 RepID=UPI001BFC86A8|nr:ABZJ_00895 family protein [Epibacterium ulvae]MBT8153380.1 ABZJ_00895 family protein [Epibacterium ulvae]
MDLKRYALNFILTALALMVVNYALLTFADVDIGNAGMGLIPIFLAAMLEGQRYAREHGDVPESRAMWQFSKQAAMVVVAINMVLVAALSFVLPDLRYLMTQSWGPGVLLCVILVVGVISFLLTRQFLGMGARTTLKAEAKKRKKQ